MVQCIHQESVCTKKLQVTSGILHGVYIKRVSHNYFIQCHRKYVGQHNQWDIHLVHDGKVGLNTYMLFAGREVRIAINCARGLEYGPRPQAVRAVPKIEGTVFPNTDRPRPATYVFIIFFRRVLCKQFLC